MVQPVLEPYRFHEREWDSYEQLRAWFEWEVPDRFNIAEYVCDRWAGAEGTRTALIAAEESGRAETWTYSRLDRAASALADTLRRWGVSAGDRVGVCCAPSPETAAALIACWKCGAVVVPISTLFGPDAVAHPVRDAEIRVAIVDDPAPFRRVREGGARPERLVVRNPARAPDDLDAPDTTYEAAVAAGDTLETSSTRAEDRALVLYTSGTTGDPKGVAHAHRFLLNNLPGFLTATCNLDLREDDVVWTQAEWAWFATLFCVLLPALYYGKRVLAHDGGEFDPETAWALLDRHDVTQFVAPPAALRRMRANDDGARACDALRTITCGAHDADLAEWTSERFENAVVHENYGQTETGTIAGECTRLVETGPGCLGPAVPGYEVGVVDPERGTHDVPAGAVGEIATRIDDRPVCLDGYWQDPERTAAQVADGWWRTGDLGREAADGTLTFEGRRSAVIISAGHSIGPKEVEECLQDHRAIADAGVIGVPDEERGEVPKAFVELAAGHELSERTRDSLRTHVRQRLAQYKYPREFEAVDTVPRDRGKVQRDRLRRRENADTA